MMSAWVRRTTSGVGLTITMQRGLLRLQGPLNDEKNAVVVIKRQLYRQ